MRATILALLLTLAVWAPGTAHEETLDIDWAGRVGSIIEGMAAWTTPDDMAAGAPALADTLRSYLLMTIPGECYLDSWVAAWLVYADLLRFSELPATSAIDRLTIDTDVMAGVFETCPLAAAS